MRIIITHLLLVLLTLITFSDKISANTNFTINNVEFSNIDFNFKISPNPAKNKIIVKLNSKTKARIFIHDSLGNEVLTEDINYELIKEISLEDLNSGIYFISAKTDTKTVIKRFVKY